MEDNMKSMTLEDILALFDVEGKIFDSYQVVSALNSLPESEYRRKECQYECLAFMLQPNAQDKSFGGYYGPQTTYVDKNCNIKHVPSFDEITKDAVSYWEQRYKVANSSLMKMRYSGLVWDFKKRIINEKNDNDLYRTYVDSMLDVCNNDLTSHPTITTTIFYRLFSIACKQEKDLIKVKASLRSFENRHAADDSVNYWSCQIKLMIDNKKLFSQEEIYALIKEHEERMSRLFVSIEDNYSSVWVLEKQCDLLADFYNRESRKDDVRRVLKVSEEAYRKTFVSDGSVHIQAVLTSFYHKYNHYNLRNEAKSLLLEIQNIGTEVTSAMTTQQFKVSIPKQVFDQLDERFGAKANSDEKRLRNFLYYFIPDKNQEEKSLLESIQQNPLLSLMPTQFLDYKGRPQSLIGSYDNDKEGQLVIHMTKKLNIDNFFLYMAIKKMNEVGQFTPERIMEEIIKPCPLFEDNSYPVIRQALDFYFQEIPVITCHLLVPQIENAIRNLVEESGCSVIKHQEKKLGFQLITLDELLYNESVKKVFPFNGDFYLRLVLTDQRSLNIRNNICHGILPPINYDIYLASRLLHVLILIGMVGFEK